MIIAKTDFVDRPFKIPNQNEAQDLESFIEDIEERIAMGTLDECITLLGVELWREFESAVNTSGTIEAKWLALRDGADYVYNGVTYRYNGWVDMIRPLIYSRWLPATTDKVTNIGMIKNSAPQQSKLTDDYYPSVVSNWNETAKKVGCQPNCGYNYKNSFYGFMKANESDYDNWVFKCPQFKNRHDF